MTDAPLLFFHDTSVLVNFHRPGLIPVLGPLLRDNVCWTATIRAECERKQRQLELPGLVDAAEELLGDMETYPVRVPAELRHAESSGAAVAIVRRCRWDTAS